MRTYTAHLKAGRRPVLVRESWSWGAALFGPAWMLLHRAWIPAVLYGAVLAILSLQAPGALLAPALLGLTGLAGLLGRDLVRWSLARRGYDMAHVLVARDEDGALGRLLMARTDITEYYVDLPR